MRPIQRECDGPEVEGIKIVELGSMLLLALTIELGEGGLAGHSEERKVREICTERRDASCIR